MRRFEAHPVVAAVSGGSAALPPLVELAEMLEERHPDLDAHGSRVAASAQAIAKEMGLPAPAVARVTLAARLHDIGKVWISSEILNKPGPLDEEEWTEIRRHPSIGARLLQSAELWELADIVVAHHERPDASGYPQGIAAAEAPLEAQIVAVADVHDAMLSPRPYGPTLTPEQARAELVRVAATQLDAGVVDAFLRVLDRAPELAPVTSIR